MRRAVVCLALLATAMFPAAAAAQDAQPGQPAAPAKKKAQAVAASMTLSLARVGGKRRVALARDRIRVTGRVSAYVPGERVEIRVFRGKHRIQTKFVALQPRPDGSAFFLLGVSPSRPGKVVILAVHAASAALGEFSAASQSIEILPRRVGRRSGRVAIRALQSRLARLGYVVGRRGRFDARTGRAVLAFRKVTRMARTTQATKSVMRRIAAGGGVFRMRYPSHGRHMEADISRQVLVLIAGRKVQRIYPISSGKASTPTVLGHFRVYSKTPGTNAKGMVDSAYFIRGYATHGYPQVPVFPASHGCLRVPIPDARRLFNWITIGTPIDTYR
jgi:hypothetical protein